MFLVCLVLRCLSGQECLVTKRSLTDREGERWWDIERSCVEQNYWEMEGTLEIALKCTQIKLTSWCIFVTLQQWGFETGWKACVEKGNALSQCHAYIAFQPAIARESRSALFHHSIKSTLQSQGWSSIFSDTVPPGAFPCPGLVRRKVHILYQWQPQALNLVQRRRRIQQVNTLDSFNLPLVFLFSPSEPVVEGVKCQRSSDLKLCGMWCGGKLNSFSSHKSSHMQWFVRRLHAITKSNFKFTNLVHAQWNAHVVVKI